MLPFIASRCAITISLLVVVTSMHAQYQLEHSYANAGTGVYQMFNEFYMVHLETLGDRYAFLDKTQRRIEFYSLDHQYISTIDLSAAPDVTLYPAGRDALFISQHLWDLDDGIEVMYVSQYIDTVTTSIVDEDGTVIQTWPDEAATVNLNVPQEQQPIYNSASSAKLILSNWTTGEAKVYSLPGTLQEGITSTNGSSFFSAPVKVYPNPTADEIVVDLAWQSRPNSATIEFMDSQDRVALRDPLSTTLQHISIVTLAAGEYSYRVLVNGGVVTTGKVTKL